MDMPEIFRINRVNKAIISLAERIASAQEIAESIPPIKTAVLNLQDEEGSPPISTPTNPTPTIPSQENGLQLGAIFPNTFTPDGSGEDQSREIILVVDKGEIHNYFITDKAGKQIDWRPRALKPEQLSSHTQSKVCSIQQASKEEASLKFFSITIPSNVECNSCYYFVAQSKDSKQEDRLMLFVSYGNLTGV